jgi:hypothetical protein
VQIANDVLLVLSHADTDGTALRLTGQLDRKLYERTNKVLEAAGGKWNRKLKAHIFDGDAADAMEQIILTGEVNFARPPKFGYFPTPLALGLRVSDLADIPADAIVLEPSIGQGHLAEAVKQTMPPATIKGYELLPGNIEKIGGRFDVTQADFLSITPEPIYDRVVMNPPFEKQADIRHVMHAHRFLKPTGRLVSIMSASVTFRDNKLTEDFRAFLAERDGEIEENEPGAFRESGTMVNTVTVSVFAA